MKFKLLILYIIISISILNFTGCSEKEFSDGGLYLDTMVSVTAYGEKSEEAVKAALEEIERIENLLSAYRTQSEIYKINNYASYEEVEVSSETANVLKKALEYCKKTDGAFDISVKPLVEIWDFKAENPQIPDKETIEKTKELVDYKNIIINNNKVKFKKEGMKIDLGGAAKGYCADKAVEVLKSYGIKNALLDLGGNVYAMGKNKNGSDWRIGLQDPGGQRGEHFRVEKLSDMSAVTSGSYERYFEKDGKIYHHIIDPKTGSPSGSNLISATVISKNSFEADMMSTAVFVMGKEKFNEIKDRFNFDKVIVVDKTNKESIISK